MSEIYFWKECKKTLEKDLTIEEYSTWILPLMLKENMGIRPKSYSVLAPNEFILNWVEENYSALIKDRLVAITSNPEVNISFEVNQVEEKTENEDKQTNIETIQEEQVNIKARSPYSEIRNKETHLNSNLSFEAFVEGKSNHIAPVSYTHLTLPTKA